MPPCPLILAMTKDHLSALEWAIKELSTRDDHRVADLRSFFSQLKKAESQRGIPPELDQRRIPDNLLVFMAKHRLTIPSHEITSWRMVPLIEQVSGHINGLPESYGTLRATNGVLCYIELADGSLYGEGHVDFWIPDPRFKAVKINHDGTPKKRTFKDEIFDIYS